MTSRLERVTDLMTSRRRNCIPAGRYSTFLCWNTRPRYPLKRIPREPRLRQSKSAARGLVGLGPISGRDLLGQVGPPLDLLLDPLVVLRKLLGLGDAAHLEPNAGSKRAFLRPLLGLLDRRHVE